MGDGPGLSRRIVVAAAAAGLLPALGEAQARRRLIAILHPGAPSRLVAEHIEAFRRGLHERGYSDSDFTIKEWWAELHMERLPALAAEIVRERPDVIVAAADHAALAAKGATKTIPVVMGISLSPVRGGVVASLAHPGGNVTGLSFETLDTAAKRLQLLKTAVPKARRVAVLTISTDPARGQYEGESLNGPSWRQLQQDAARLEIELVPITARFPKDLAPAFATMAKRHMDGVYVSVAPLFLMEAARIAGLAAQARLPAVYGLSAYVRAGGLITLAPDEDAMWRRAAAYVDRIFKGAKPADLPIEQPTRFVLTLNLKAAKALGLVFPPDLLARADGVIQ
jgi:ABC-type uncharacterized transport system substrate-binding protein